MQRRRVVITGLGAVTPLGLTAGESWQGAREGRCGIGPITLFDPADQKVKLAAEVKGFEPEQLLGRQQAKAHGPLYPVCGGRRPGRRWRAPPSTSPGQIPSGAV